MFLKFIIIFLFFYFYYNYYFYKSYKGQIKSLESFKNNNFDSKKVLILYPVNGLMNRIRSIISAKIIADQHNLLLILIWKPQKNICNCNYFDIFGNNTNLWQESNTFVEQFLKKNNIDINNINNNFKLGKIIENDNKLFYWENQNERKSMTKFIKNKSRIKIIKSGGKFFLNNNNLDKLFSKIHKNIKYNDYIINNIPKIKSFTLGVHIRCTDVSQSCLDSYTILKEINRLIKKHNIKNIFIISNSLEKKDEIINSLNINIIKSNTNDTNRNNKLNLQNAMIEWLSLTKCKYLLLTKTSTFSIEAHNYNLGKYTYYLEPPNINLHN